MRRAAPHVSAAAATSHSAATEHADDANEGGTTGTFRWLTLHHLALGPLAIGCAIAYGRVGLVGLLAFGLPVALLTVRAQRSIRRTRAAVAGIERENAGLRRSNGELRRSNADLADVAEFAAGLAAETRDSHGLARYAQSSLEQLTGGKVAITVGDDPTERATALRASGRIVGSLLLEGGDAAQWSRLRDTVEPQLAKALESTMLAEEVRKTHLGTIAALTRSIAARDNGTSGHTERVSDIAVGIGRRLGFNGADLDAIEIGALMHDIGKIGIPESILHKPGPLDDDEWVIMKRHPVISELILSENELSPIVLQIARSMHERMDGQGYPDGLAGEEIPLPARIVLVADAFDALTTDRPYRRARRPKAALEEIGANAGPQFCPRVVAALERMYEEEPQRLGEIPLTVVASA
jgi:HD-GYP domain-containing protein (c-di-GMP phosphodiesterase class II)